MSNEKPRIGDGSLVHMNMKKLLFILLLLLILAGVILYFFPNRMPTPLQLVSQAIRQWIGLLERRIYPEPEAGPENPTYEVVWAIDGDTLLIAITGQEVSVRLIGIDAPESVHREVEKNTPEGEQASQWMKSFIQGKKVSLEYDEELNDRYGRTLAYVYVDGVLLEDILLREGMARTLIMEPNTRYQHHFEQIEKEARESGAGFWGTGFFRDEWE